MIKKGGCIEFLTNYFGWLSRILNFFSSWITGVKGGENYFAQSLNRQELKSVIKSYQSDIDNLSLQLETNL